VGAPEKFSRQIEARLVAARREPRWQPAEAAQFMAELEPRRRQFEEIAPRLVKSIIRPRLQAVASYFPNVAPDRGDRSDRSTFWFGYCERFPADTKVEIAIEHDERIENLVIHYELHIMPVFLKFEPLEKLTMPLASVDEQVIAEWVEAKLLAFLDTYLRLDRGQDDFEDEVVVDPVCGMRISRSSAGATMDYRGHPYYFCSKDCRQRFAKEPMQYIRFETG
jgi:YHS domain-containing protein